METLQAALPRIAFRLYGWEAPVAALLVLYRVIMPTERATQQLLEREPPLSLEAYLYVVYQVAM
jgi:hypothetical protein